MPTRNEKKTWDFSASFTTRRGQKLKVTFNVTMVDETHLSKTSFSRSDIYQLWDSVLDILFERVDGRYLPISQLRHLIPELQQLLSSAKGAKFLTNSVVDLLLVFLVKDATVLDLRHNLQCSQSTIYRSLVKLERIGFVEPIPDKQNGKYWTIVKKNFPVLYRASRS